MEGGRVGGTERQASKNYWREGLLRQDLSCDTLRFMYKYTDSKNQCLWERLNTASWTFGTIGTKSIGGWGTDGYWRQTDERYGILRQTDAPKSKSKSKIQLQHPNEHGDHDGHHVRYESLTAERAIFSFRNVVSNHAILLLQRSHTLQTNSIQHLYSLCPMHRHCRLDRTISHPTLRRLHSYYNNNEAHISQSILHIQSMSIDNPLPTISGIDTTRMWIWKEYGNVSTVGEHYWVWTTNGRSTSGDTDYERGLINGMFVYVKLDICFYYWTE